MTIAEVSEKYKLSIDTLRYYERISLIPPVPRNKKGGRVYGEKDLQWVQFSKDMRKAGIPIEVLIEYVDLYQQGCTTYEARKEILQDPKQQLTNRIKELQEAIKKLDHKIKTSYNGIWEDKTQ
jgi:DNA-binding transcriptional MerR regulator